MRESLPLSLSLLSFDPQTIIRSRHIHLNRASIYMLPWYHSIQVSQRRLVNTQITTRHDACFTCKSPLPRRHMAAFEGKTSQRGKSFQGVDPTTFYLPLCNSTMGAEVYPNTPAMCPPSSLWPFIYINSQSQLGHGESARGPLLLDSCARRGLRETCLT